MQSRPEKRPFPPECLPRLQLERCRTPFLCNRGWENAPFRRNVCRGVRRAVCSGTTACCIVRPLSYTPLLAVRPAATARAVCSALLAAFATGVPQKADSVQSRPGEMPLLAGMPCRVCNWNAAERRFCAIAAGRMPLSAGMLVAFASGVSQNADFVQSRPEKRPFWPECLPRLLLECRRTPISCNRGRENAFSCQNACCVCNRNAAERRFRAIAAGETPLSARMPCREHPFPPECLPRLQLECRRRPISCNRGWEKCPFPPECLPRLQLECRRTPFSCNRSQKNAPCGRNACRVCIWNAAERRFHAIAAGESPLLARTLAAFVAGTLQNADFMQSRPENRPFWPECLVPRLQLECRRTPFLCNRGLENTSPRLLTLCALV